MKYRFLFLMLIVSHVAVAQGTEYTYITKYDPPKSPNASAFEQHLTIPDNYQTGQVNPAVPLMNFSLDGLDVPISLTYSSTGMKLTDVATWVGQGWNLNVGGTITRSVRGIPDDCPSGGLMSPYWAAMLDSFINSQTNTMTWTTKFNYFRDIIKQYADSEHDIFYYDALGAKGAFYINRAGNCVQFPRTNNLITYAKNAAGYLISFTITTDRGDKFFFTEEEQSTIINNTSNDIEQDTYYNLLQGSTWYLTQIQTKNNQIINFTYNHYHYNMVDKIQSQSFIAGVGTPCFSTYNSSLVTNNITTQVNISQLSQINWKNGFINFSAGQNRTDLGAFDPSAAVPCLAGIAMYRSDTAFSQVNATLIQNISFDYTQLPRLFLNDVNFKGNGTVTDHSYSFIYTGSAPAYPTATNSGNTLINAQDYWGYYNGANNYELLAYDVIGSQYGMIGLNGYLQRNNRTSSVQFASTGMLQEIHYPTGGKTKFYYEGNMAPASLWGGANLLINSLTQSTNPQGVALVTLGGVRVNKLEFYTDSAAASPSTVTNIVYDPTAVNVNPVPFYVSSLESDNLEDPDLQNYCDLCEAALLYTIHSSSMISYPGSLIEYGKVTEYSGAANSAGQTVHNFNFSQIGGGSSYSAVPYPTPQYLNYYAGEIKTAIQLPSGNSVVEKGMTHNLNNAALLVGQTGYDQDIKVAVIHNDECESAANIDRVPIDESDADQSFSTIFGYGYSIVSSDNYVTTGNYTNSYDPNTVEITDQTNYRFNNTQKNLLLPNSTSKLTSKGDTSKVLLAYPQDYFTTIANTQDSAINGLVNLINKNVLTIPVEQIDVINKGGADSVTGASLVVFRPDKLAVSKIYRLAISQPIALSSFTRSYENAGGIFVFDSRYQLEKQFFAFNSISQPLEFFDKPSGVRHSIIWDYMSTYPIAEVVGPPPTTQSVNLPDIAYTSFEADSTGGWNINMAAILSDATAPTGNKCYNLGVGLINDSKLTSVRSYIVSYWIKNQTTPLGLTNGSVNLASNTVVQGPTVNGWTYFQHSITGTTEVQLAGTCLVDELRLYPAGSQMTTYAYSPLIGMTGQCDVDNRITFYSYDGLGRLKYVKDQNGNIIRTIDYHYKGH